MPAARQLDFDFLTYLQTSLSDDTIISRTSCRDPEFFRAAVKRLEEELVPEFDGASTKPEREDLDKRIRQACEDWFSSIEMLNIRRWFTQYLYRHARKLPPSHRESDTPTVVGGVQLKPGDRVVPADAKTAALLDQIIEQEGLDDSREALNWLCRSYFIDTSNSD